MLPHRPKHREHGPLLLLCGAIIIGSFLALLLIVATSPPRSVYDETWYLATLQVLNDHGLSIAFLRHLPGPPGPTFTLVYSAIESVLPLTLPWLRVVSIALLAGCSVLLAGTFAVLGLRLPGVRQFPSSLILAGILVALPTTAVSAGMVLTELPALFFVLIFVLIAADDERNIRTGLSVLAGIALGIGILGRQNYLVILPCMLALVERPLSWPRVRFVVVAGFFAALLSGAVFVVWGGLVPPQMASLVGTAVNPWYFVLSASYLGLVTFLVAPESYLEVFKKKSLGLGAALGAVAVSATLGERFVPARSIMGFLDPGLAGWFFAFLMSLLAVAFLIVMAHRLYQQRDIPFMRFTGAVVIAGAISNANIHQFSSRYIFLFLPFLLISLASSIRLTWHLPLRLLFGTILGLVSLTTYFR